MMDEDTLTVAYRSWRGEPRGKGKTRDDLGDCIDCNACVNVCPMGIDIRDGQQLACITCALCIDACDDIMDKVGKPRGLIDYMALTDEKLERAGGKGKEIWQHILTVAPVRNPVYVVLSDGAIRNTYEVRLRNKNGDDRPFHVSITSDEILRVQLEGTDELVVMVPADETFMQRVYVIAPAGQPAAALPRVPVRIWVEDMTNGERAYTDTVFNGRPQ
jgi:polyferredoxin